MRVCGHLSVCACVDICLYACVWTSVCMRVCGHLSVCVCVDICLYACVWTSVCVYVQLCVCLCVVCLCVCVDICVYELVCVSVCVWTCTCKCVSLLFCNVNVYHFHSYHYCSIWHGYTVHNDMESLKFKVYISCKLVNVVLQSILMQAQEIGDNLTCHILQ